LLLDFQIVYGYKKFFLRFDCKNYQIRICEGGQEVADASAQEAVDRLRLERKDRCYNFIKYIFAPKIGEKIVVFDAKHSLILQKVDHNIGF
jgi:hypothetical protein